MIFIGCGEQMAELYSLAMDSRARVGDNIRMAVTKEGITRTMYESMDDLILYTDMAQIVALTQNDIDGWENCIFVDSELPDSAIRASIDKLGLRGYMFRFGICDKEKDNG